MLNIYKLNISWMLEAPYLGVGDVVGVGGVDGLHQPVDVGAQGQVLLLRALNPSLQLKAKILLQ
jgi:hypothetical protein